MSIAVAPVAERQVRDSGEVIDAELVAAARGGDDRAFERLYARYQRRISAYVYGMVSDHGRAEDITQEVFIAALRRMRQTDRPIAFRPWIYEIAKNACIDQFRRSRRAEEVSYDVDGGLGAADAGRLVSTAAAPETAVDAKQQLSDLCGAFGGLSDSHHRILVLRELEGLSYREIGERMGLSRPSVESTLFRARRRLEEEYDELATGRRCERIQGLMDRGAAGVRDRRRLSRHLSHCKACRRHARALGVDRQLMPDAVAVPPVIERVAGLLPLPLFIRLRRGGGPPDTVSSSLSAQVQATAAQWSAGLSSLTEPLLGGFGRGAATAAAVAAGTVGAALGGQQLGTEPPAPARSDLTRIVGPHADRGPLPVVIAAVRTPPANGDPNAPGATRTSGARGGAATGTSVRGADSGAVGPSSGTALTPSVPQQPPAEPAPTVQAPPVVRNPIGTVRNLTGGKPADRPAPTGSRASGLTAVPGVHSALANTEQAVRQVAGEPAGSLVGGVRRALGD